MREFIDKRSKKIISPSPDWKPDGVVNTLKDIIDKDGTIIGNVEVGTDGFVQAIWNADGLHWRLEVHPSADKAVVKAWALR